MNCVFCKIIDGTIPSYTIYEDDLVKCFLDINPDSNGHTLIVPKDHIKDIIDISPIVWGHILKITKLLNQRLEDKLNIDGLTLIQNNGDIQDVKHFHLHLKPYYNEKKDIIDVNEIYEILKEDKN